MAASSGVGLRELTRRAVRTQIAETAMELFVAKGYEETTVDEIAAAVGISGRSVFRYFPTKEDIVVGLLDGIGDELAAALAARPRDEPPWVALRNAMTPHLDSLTRDSDRTIATAMLLADTPALRGALLAKRARWAEALVPDISRRLKLPPARRDLAARSLVGAALTCLNNAVDDWARSNGRKPLAKLLDTAIAAVRG
ncbi:DNA-binding transcriptional regulator, AcrR family [Asanoa hainanensis]|uniref:DNA-binding transcriptional regulator, AcrR family n=1 Tax=Asanoa hainanensis TaxID=560556 RepID=A0A239L9F5_9ACTN|nr:TetR/AcrR family transcriptional regulator [Asanoa hainanensis]SNT27246.1 DNA-binding transcriptional regulator, AcrR family [Asanoa hainanensis]